MNIFPCVILVIAMACTLPAAANNHLSTDAAVNHARELIHRDAHRKALIILRPLAHEQRTDITDIRFLIGMAAISATESGADEDDDKDLLLSEAAAAFHAILINHPRLTRVRLELARAFFLQGKDALSTQHFNMVLAGDPPPAMAANIQRFLYALRARSRWSGYFSINLEQNDNINTGTETKTIYLFGLPFQVNENSRPREETGITVSAGREYQQPLNEQWRWRYGVDASRADFSGHDIDQNFLLLRTGPRWLLNATSEASLQLTAAQRWLGANRHSNEYGLRLNAHRQIKRNFGVNGTAFHTEKLPRLNTQQSSTEQTATIGATYLFTPLLQGNAAIGIHNERLESGDKSREQTLSLGLSVILPKGWTLGGNHQWAREKYNRNAPSSTELRLDEKRTARLFLLNRRFTIFAFSPQIIITNEQQKSNSALDIYQRTRVGIRMIRQW